MSNKKKKGGAGNPKKYVGTTIHTGWFPLLTSTKPQKAFSKSKSARGVAASGYNQAFIKHVEAVAAKKGKEKTLSLLKKPIITEAAMGEVIGGAKEDELPIGGNLLTGERVTRGRKWSDVVPAPRAIFDKEKQTKPQYDDASRYQEATKKFQLRGNFVWYNEPRGGPKPLAEAIISNNFSFQRAEKWYTGSFSKAGSNMKAWASKTLGMEDADLATPAEVKQIGKSVGETVLKGGKLKKVESYDESVTPQPRDMKYKGGPAEISEMKLNDKHGYPSVPSDIDTSALKTVLDNHASNVWNKTVDTVIESEKKQLKLKGINNPTTEQAGASVIGKTSKTLIMQSGANVSANMMNKIKHEMADFIKGFGAKKAASDWTDVLRADSIIDPQTGMRRYHKIDLSMDKKFHITVDKVSAISGIEAGQALLASHKRISLKQSLNHSLTQQIAFAHNFSKNIGNTRTHNNMTMQTCNNLSSAAVTKTEVSFSPKVAKDYVDGIIDRFGEIIENKLTGAEKEIQDAVTKKAVKYNKYGGIFWAAPYIGIEEGINIR